MELPAASVPHSVCTAYRNLVTPTAAAQHLRSQPSPPRPRRGRGRCCAVLKQHKTRLYILGRFNRSIRGTAFVASYVHPTNVIHAPGPPPPQELQQASHPAHFYKSLFRGHRWVRGRRGPSFLLSSFSSPTPPLPASLCPRAAMATARARTPELHPGHHRPLLCCSNLSSHHPSRSSQ
ncbi:hypothetical protein ZWY2020_005898 [Hordeum vulgare]|nr:hypothetical protein ZWY2020_005898 [Hordeum vulgare]